MSCQAATALPIRTESLPGSGFTRHAADRERKMVRLRWAALCILAVGAVSTCLCAVAATGGAHAQLEIYFIDVEGGQSTLVVTPDRHSLLLIRTFVDHEAPSAEAQSTSPETKEAFAAYQTVRGANQHITPKPGDRLPLQDAEVTVVSSVGDLTGPPLFKLACPADLVGPVDAYLVAHHGGPDVMIDATFAALKPRVAIMNNGQTKGGAQETYQALHHVTGLEDVWQLHASSVAGASNFPPQYIANLDESSASWIKLIASADGSFRVLNQRTGQWKLYPPRAP